MHISRGWISSPGVIHFFRHQHYDRLIVNIQNTYDKHFLHPLSIIILQLII